MILVCVQIPKQVRDDVLIIFILSSERHPDEYRDLSSCNTPFDTLRGSGSGALINIRYQNRCLSRPAKILKSTMV
jgi:hypothetical protein